MGRATLALINGSPTTYKITIVDNGRPGAGTADVFRIETSSGFSGGGALTGGNFQVG